MIKRLILGLLLIILVVLFTLNNTTPTPLYLVGMTVTVPLALLLVVALALGAAVAILFLIGPAIKDRRALRDCRRRLEALSRERQIRPTPPGIPAQEEAPLPGPGLPENGET